MTTQNKSKVLFVRLRGEFRIAGPNEEDLTPRGQKACALIAMLLTHPDGARSRSWLRRHLWSDRGQTEGSSSLRQCLTEIRRSLREYADLFTTDRRMVRISKDFIAVTKVSGIFLENISIPDAEFQSWAEEMRRRGSFATPQVSPPIKGQQTTVPSSQTVQLQNRFPTVSVIAPLNDPRSMETAQKLRAKLTTFRWLSVFGGKVSDQESDYTISIEAAETDHSIMSYSLRDGSDRILWSTTSDQFERPDPTLDLLDDIVGNLAVLISNTEEQRAADDPRDGEVRNLIWRGRWHLNHMTRPDSQIADGLFAQAQSIAPADADVSIHIAYAAVARAWAFRLDHQALEDVISITRAAMVRTPNDARGLYNLGTALCFAGNIELARIAIDEAIELCPNMAMAWIQQGCNHLAEGNFALAVPVYLRCLALGRYERRSYIPRCGLGMAHLFLGENEQAILAAERAIALRPGYWYAHMVRGVAYRRLSVHHEAARSLQTMRSIYPHVSRADVEWLPIGDAKALDRVILDAGISD